MRRALRALALTDHEYDTVAHVDDVAGRCAESETVLHIDEPE